jgi:hypothetical protein
MSGESGFTSPSAIGFNPFTTGGFGGFGTMEDGYSDGGGGQQTEDKEIGKASQEQPAAKEASAAIKEAASKEPTMGSREQVMANPEKYGWRPGMTTSPEEYAQQYFHEAVAKLSYKDPSINGNEKGKEKDGYSDADRKFLEQWGYKVGGEVRGNGALGNTESGMYAVRFEPLDPKSGSAPVVAFRGSEFNENFVDWRTDLTDSTIGKRQYDASRKEIDALMKVAPGQRLEVTGHSLGGALAQKAAAEHAKDIGAVTTFQAPGVDYTDAAKFNANKNNDVRVNHHYVSSDVVHRAGEQKLDGNFFEHHVAGAGGVGAIGGSHTANLLHNPGDNSYIGDGSNPLGTRDSVTKHDKDVQGDRHFFEGLRQLIGVGALGPLEGLVSGLEKGVGGVLTGAKEIGAGLKNGFMNAMNGITGGMSTAWDGAKKGGSEMAGGFKQMMSGNILGGLGGIGKGMWDGASGLVSGAGQAVGGVASGLWEGAKGLGTGLWDAGKGLVGGAGDLIGGVLKAPMGIAKGLGHLGIAGAQALINSDAGQGIANGVSHAIGGVGSAIGDTGKGLGTAAKNTLGGIADAGSTAWNGMKKGGGELLGGASDLLHGNLSGLGGIGKGLWSGASGLLSGGANAAGSVLSGIGSGAAAVGKGAWNAGKSIVGGIGEAGKGIASTASNVAGAAWDGAKSVGGAIAGKAKSLLSGW